jgi:hypothetical protein
LGVHNRFVCLIKKKLFIVVWTSEMRDTIIWPHDQLLVCLFSHVQGWKCNSL